MNHNIFLQVAHRELSQAPYTIEIYVNFVSSLPVVESESYLDNIHLHGISLDRYWLPWTDGIGVWVSCNGCRVEIVISEAFDDVEVESSLANFMTAVVMGACLNLQSRVAIHANAVGLAGLAAAFVGYSGRGKSTLTAYCLSRGAGFVTDDVLSVDAVGQVNLGYPRVKLYPHTAESLGMDALKDTKYKIHYYPEQLGGKIHHQPIPLKVIYLLDESSDDCIYSEQLPLTQAVFELLTHSYYASHLIPHNHSLLDAYIRLVTQATVKKLFYTRKMAILPKVYNFLLEEIHQL